MSGFRLQSRQTGIVMREPGVGAVSAAGETPVVAVGAGGPWERDRGPGEQPAASSPPASRGPVQREARGSTPSGSRHAHPAHPFGVSFQKVPWRKPAASEKGGSQAPGGTGAKGCPRGGWGGRAEGASPEGTMGSWHSRRGCKVPEERSEGTCGGRTEGHAKPCSDAVCRRLPRARHALSAPASTPPREARQTEAGKSGLWRLARNRATGRSMAGMGCLARLGAPLQPEQPGRGEGADLRVSGETEAESA